MWIIITSILFIILLYIYYNKISNKIPLIKAAIKLYIIVKLRELLSETNSKDNNNTINFKDNHVNITYYFNGNFHNLRLPHNPKNKIKMHQMILVKNDNNEYIEIDITHKHGLPYYLSAKDLGGHKIIHKKGDDIIQEFVDNELPYI